MRPSRVVALLLAAASATGCVTRQSVSSSVTKLPAGTEAVSLYNEPLFAVPVDPEERPKLEAALAEARDTWAAHPDSALALVWVGRRLAALGRFQEAIATWSDGIDRFPTDPRFPRFRGYRFVSVRNFEGAVVDLTKAREMLAGRAEWDEPEETSSIQAGTRYQLALAHYLLGHFDVAAPIQRESMDKAASVDTRVANAYWYVMTLRRLGRDAEATRVLADYSRATPVDHSTAYLRLLLLFKGELPADSLVGKEPDLAHPLEEATLNYGIGVWHLVNGRRDAAITAWRRSRAGTWAGFGAIAAEADLKRAGVAIR
jgi:tetratricopeptide (TPR) repeat protein